MRIVFIVRFALAVAVFLGLNCRTDDVPKSPPAELGPALLPLVWEKPRINVGWMDPPVDGSPFL